jgi:hypothetical protein
VGDALVAGAVAIRDTGFQHLAVQPAHLVGHDGFVDRGVPRLLVGHMIVGSLPCSCGRHTTWECECSDVTYEPALMESCSLSNGRGGGL